MNGSVGRNCIGNGPRDAREIHLFWSRIQNGYAGRRDGILITGPLIALLRPLFVGVKPIPMGMGNEIIRINTHGYPSGLNILPSDGISAVIMHA